MAVSIATIEGVALVPGVSRNHRYYSPETIAKAVARAQQRIADGGMPLTMLTHHEADDDSTRIVGRITKIWLDENGAARYRAVLADTAAARTILDLIDQGGDGAFLENVSIRGYWRGEVRTVLVDNVECTTTDDLELDGLDFTKTPGVPGARIDSVSRIVRSTPSESAGRTPIYESAEARVHDQSPVREQAPDVVYADNGYLSPGQKLYPLSTRGEALAAWAVLATTETAARYTAAQLKRARGRTRKAMEAHGVTITSEGALRMAGPIEGSVAEMWADSRDRRGGFHVSLNHGELSVTVSSYCVDPHDLDRIARAAMTAAADALSAITADPDAVVAAAIPAEGGKPAFLDKDDDEDDDPAASDKDDDDEDPTGEKPKESTDPAATAAAVNREDPAVADTTTQETDEQRVERLVAEKVAAKQAAAAEEARIEALVAERLAAAQTPQETDEQRIERIVAERLAAAQPQETEEQRIERLVAEKLAAAQPVETEEQRIDRLVQAKLAGAVQDVVAQSGVARKGFPATQESAPGAAPVAETGTGYPADWPTNADGSRKEIHQLTAQERYDHAMPALDVFVTSQLATARRAELGL